MKSLKQFLWSLFLTAAAMAVALGLQWYGGSLPSPITKVLQQR